MSEKRNLRRIHLQSGCTDRMNRRINGLFEVLLDDDGIVEQMTRAHNNKSRMCTDGPVIVVYHPCTQAQADYVVAHPEQAGPNLKVKL
jgi:hypothetical protein